MKMKRFLTLVMALAVCLSLAACGGNSAEGGNGGGEKVGANEANYKISVVDALGNPVPSGVIVRIMQNGEQVEMQVANEQGIMEKVMPKGDYTVELKFTDSNAAYYYDSENLSLSADKTELKIVLYNTISGEGQTLFVPVIDGDDRVEANVHDVSVGSTYLTPTVDARNYYMFTPTQSGTYTFALTQGEGTLGYYGAPHFVQKQTAIEPVDGVITISIAPSMIGEQGSTSSYVLGLDAKSESAVLAITRTGDHQRTIEDEPWTEYVTSHTPTAFTFEPTAGKTLTYVDIYKGTAEDYPVVLGSDGFYHMGDENGSLVYINLGKEAPNASFYLMINGDGLGGGAPVRKYFFNENGDFVKKEDYTAIMLEYMACMDEKTGLYPLTADLVYIIETRSGWWTADHADYIFDGCNPKIGWLFACCYEK